MFQCPFIIITIIIIIIIVVDLFLTDAGDAVEPCFSDRFIMSFRHVS